MKITKKNCLLCQVEFETVKARFCTNCMRQKKQKIDKAWVLRKKESKKSLNEEIKENQ